MNLAKRFNTLWEKGLCFLEQHGSNTKNKDGKCKRNSTCKDASHDNNKTKKHVLVSSQHQENHDITKICWSNTNQDASSNKN